MTTVDTEHLSKRLTSLGVARSEAEARLLAEARRELDMAELHTLALNAGMSLAADFVRHAEANVESLLYAIRVLRGVA